VANVAGTVVPVVLHLLYWGSLKDIAEFHSQECFPLSAEWQERWLHALL